MMQIRKRDLDATPDSGRAGRDVLAARLVVASLILAGVFGVAGAAVASKVPISAGEIVFASDRATPSVGIDVLTPRGAPRALVPDRLANVAAVSSLDNEVAYWTERAGGWQVVVTRSDGVTAPRVWRGGPLSGGPSDSPLLSADGSVLLSPVRVAGRARLVLGDVRSGELRLMPRNRCDRFGASAISHDDQLISCSDYDNPPHLIVLDTQGRLRFEVSSEATSDWSSAGLLAYAVGASNQTRIVDEHGAIVDTLAGRPGAWSPDGRSLLVARPGALVVYDPATRTARPLARGPRDWWGSLGPQATFTPDGLFVAYQSATDKPFIVPLAGGAPTAVPASTSVDSAVGVWSGDGRYAYLRWDRDGVGTVMVGDRFGRHARSRGHVVYDSHSFSELSWLADGRLLYTFSARRPSDLWAVRPDGQGLRRLTRSSRDLSSPAWSSDGKHLAYVASAFADGACGFCAPSVVVADENARHVHDVPHENTGNTIEIVGAHASWSPDARHLVAGFDCGCASLDVVEPDGSGRRQLTGGDSWLPVWSPDGRKIVYVAGGGAIWMTTPSGTSARRLVAKARGGTITGLAWAPNGRQLAYTTSSGIFEVAANGGPPTQVLRAKGASHPSYSPDSHRIVFAGASSVDGTYDLFLVDANGRGLHTLLAGLAADYDPAWRPTVAR